MSAVRRPVLCGLAGLAVWSSFPPLSWWWAAVVGIAVFTLALRGASTRQALVGGWLFGAATLTPTLSFLRGLGVDAWLAPSLIEALWFALLGVAVARVTRLRWWPLAVPLLWAAQEFARDRWPFGGLPWGRVAFGQTHGPLLPLAALGGAPLLTLSVALLAAVTAYAVARAGRRTAALVAAALCWGVAVGGAALVHVPTAGTDRNGPAHTVVALIQGNVPRLGLGEFAQRRAVTANHAAQTTALAGDVDAGRVPRPDLVVWPENASDQDPYVDAPARAMIDGAVRAVGVPVVVGAVLDGPGPHHVSNAAIVWSPTTGPGERYLKRHLVPFGEYLPFRSLLSRWVGRFSLIPDDFAPGRAPGVLHVGAVTIADAICFEVADDGVVREAVVGGGRLLVVQTNNATYERAGDDGHGGETAQQLEISRLRAVEHGRAVVVAATSGVSAVIAPDGRILQRSGVFRPARLVADVPLRDSTTVADRLGAWPERVLALAGIAALAATWWPPRRRRERGTPTSTVEPPVLAGQP